MITLAAATALMVAVVGAAGRWASVRNRQIQAEWSNSDPAAYAYGEEAHARDHQ